MGQQRRSSFLPFLKGLTMTLSPEQEISQKLTILLAIQFPQLQSSVKARLGDRRCSYLYAAHKKGTSVQVIFTPTLFERADWLAIVKRAAVSALEIRRGQTEAHHVYEGEWSKQA